MCFLRDEQAGLPLPRLPLQLLRPAGPLPLLRRCLPAHLDLCDRPRFANPLWIYIVIGLLVIAIIVGSIIILLVMRRRRRRMQLQREMAEEHREVEAELERQPTPEEPTLQVNKKNIYVYEREAEQEKPPAGTRALSSSVSSGKSGRSRRRRGEEAGNPFEKRSFIG